MTVHTALAEASTQIARRDAETLLAHLLHRDRAWIFAHPEAALDPPQLEAFRALTLRRASHEPLQHLTGRQEFYGLSLHVTPDTLIPRPETELLVEAVLAWAVSQPGPLRILDIGTGTGAIALALAKHLPSAEITATDISAAALSVARDNAESLDLADRVRFTQSDLLAALTPELDAGDLFDAIVSNPPYIPLTDAPNLQPEVVDNEPHLALFAGPDGLGIYRRLIPQAHAALPPNGLLALEFGFGQSEAITALLDGWQNVRILDDYAGIPRIALATRPYSIHRPRGTSPNTAI
jgi:release factor glutamine methyltransferase